MAFPFSAVTNDISSTHSGRFPALPWLKRRAAEPANPEPEARKRTLVYEPLEPRLLLSADFLPIAADAMADGLDQLGDRIDEFFTEESLLNERIPFLLSVKEDSEGFVVDEAPTISELFTVPVDVDGDGQIAHLFGLDASEADLEDLDSDTDPDGFVDAGEFLDGWFFQPVQAFLNAVSEGDTTTDFTDFLEGNIFDSLDQSLTDFITEDGLTISFEIIDAKVADTTENPDAEYTFEVGFELSISRDMPIDLGLEADGLRLLPFTGTADDPNPPVVDVTSTLSFAFEFGVHTGGGEDDVVVDSGDFFVRTAEPLLVSVTSSETNLDFNLNIGFLGAEVVNGDLDLQADIETTLTDPDDPDVLGFADSQFGDEQTSGTVTGDNAIPDADLAHDAGFFLRIGNLGISSAVSVADNDAASLNDLVTDVEQAIADAGLDDLIDVGLTGDDRLQFSLVSTTSSALGFANETEGDGLMGELLATPAGDGPNAFEYLADQVFLLSVGGALPRLVTVRFPDPAREDIGFGFEQEASLTENLVGQNAAVANGQLSDDAVFFVKVTQDNGTTQLAPITVTKASTDGTDPPPDDVVNGSRGDLATDINDALSAAGIGGLVSAFVSGSNIALNPAAGVSAVEIIFADAEAANEIGFVAGQKVTLSLTADDNAVGSGDLSGPATFEITVTTTSGTTSTTVTVNDDNNNGSISDLAADIDSALASAGVAVDAEVSGSKIRLVAQNSNIAAFDIAVGNQTIDDLVDDVNVALNEAGLGGQVTASADGGDLKLASSGGESLEISRTLTFDAGVTFDELQNESTSDLFSASTGADSNITFTLPVEVLPGLYNPLTDADYDPQDVAIVGNFDPFGPLSVFDEGEQRFNLNLEVDPADPEDAPIAVPDASVDLDDEIKLVNFAELLQFNVISAESMIGLLGQLGGALDNLANDGAFALYGIPFSAASLADMVDFEQLIQAELLYDVGNDGVLNEDPALATSDPSVDDESRLVDRVVVPADGDDTVQFLPAFTTAQQLATRLSSILNQPLTTPSPPLDGIGGINATYNPNNNELGYSVELISRDRVSVGVDSPFNEAFEFDVDLAPFVEFGIDTAGVDAEDLVVTLQGRSSLGMTFGVDLDPVSPIDGATKLDSLNNETGIDIKEEYAVTGDDAVRSVFGLSSDATFRVKIDSDAPVEVTVSKAAIDATDGSISAFADEVETAINAALSGATVSVSVTGDDRLEISLDSGGTNLDLLPVSKDPSALADLGFDSSVTAAPTLTGDGSPSQSFALTGDAEFTVTIGATDTDVTVVASETAGNRSIIDLVADVNNALRRAGLLTFNETTEQNEGILAEFDAGRLVLTALDDATQFDVTVDGLTNEGTVAHEELGLALGTTSADQADFIIVDRNGSEHRITLDGLIEAPDDDINALISEINNSTPGTITAGFNATGAGLRITDTSGGPDAVRVATVNGSLAALKLGFLSNPLNPDDADNPNAGQPVNPAIVEGGAIGTKALSERMFVRDGQMRGAFEMDLPAGGVDGSALFGIVGVDVTMHGSLAAGFTADLHAPGDGAGSKVTLAQLQDGDDVVSDPVVGKVSELDYDGQLFDFVPNQLLFGGSSGAKAIILGDEDNGTEGTLTLFMVDGSFADDEAIADVPGGLAFANGTDSTVDNFGEFELDVSVQDGFADLGFGSEITAALDGLSGTVPVNLTGFGDANADVAPEAELVDLSVNVGALNDFVDIGYAELIDALQQLESMLTDIESQYAFLDQTIPVINKSISDLLNLSSGFSLSVDNAVEVLEEQLALLDPSEVDVPTLTLQDIARELRGAFGLPNDSTGITVDLDPDGLLSLDFSIGEVISTTLGLDVDLGDDLPNLTSGKVLEVTGDLGLDFRIGIDLTDPTQVYLFNPDGGISGNLDILGDGAEDLGLVFQAVVGELPITVMDGIVDMHLDFDLGGLDFSDTGGRRLIGQVSFSDFTATDFSDFNVDIPLFDPSAGLTGFIGSITALGDLSNLDFDIPLDEIDDIIGDLVSGITEFNALDNLLLLADNIDFFLEGLQEFMEGDLFGIQLPLIGDNLGEGARFIEDFRNGFINDLRNFIETATDISVDDITGLLDDFFTDLGLLKEATNAISNLEDELTDVLDQEARWDITLGKETRIPFDLDFDFGIPLFGIDVDIPLEIVFDWSLDFGFGVNFEDGAFIDVSDDNELEVYLELSLPNGSFSGRLGFLELLVEDAGTFLSACFTADLFNSNGGGGDLPFTDLGNLGFDAEVCGDAELALDLSVGIAGLPSDLSAVFPRLTADFLLDWSLDATSLDDLAGDALKAGLDFIGISDIKLDAGSFLNDFLGDTLDAVTTFTEPFDEIIDVLTARIPILSDLAGEKITLLDLASVFGEVNTDFIDWIADILNVIDVINGITDGTELMIPIGDLALFDADGVGAVGNIDDLFDSAFNFDGFDFSDPGSIPGLNAIGDFDSALSAVDPNTDGSGDAQDAKDSLEELRGGEFSDLITFPFLDNPGTIVGLFLGKDVTLIGLDAPPLVVKFEYNQVFPIFGPLAATVGVGVGVEIDLSFGFDTYGFRRFAESNFTNPALIFDGFFLGDRENLSEGADIPEVTLEFSLKATAELNLGIARAGIGGGVTARIFFDWYDPNDDGAVHISELINTIENQLRFSGEPGLAPLSIFDLSGDLTFELFAFLIIDFGVFEVEYFFDITPEVTLLDFEIPFNRPPILATPLDDGTLQLNMGPNAIDRLNGDTSDGDEEFFVERISDNQISVWSPKLGVSKGQQVYEGNFTHIVGIGGQGDDSIILEGFDESNITSTLEGGVGNDTIKFVEDATVTGGALATGGGAFIRGGRGNDVLIGGHLDDVILGDEGNDVIEGGRGYDLLFGDDGSIGVATDDEGVVIPNAVAIGKRINIKDGDDTIYGGSSTDADLAAQDADDVIFGGGGTDHIYGDGGSDVIIGDGGRFAYELTGGHINVSSLRPDPFVPNDKFDPTPAESTSQKMDAILLDLSETFSGTDFGDGGNDVIFGGSDTLQSADGADIIFGGAANDTIHGQDGDDHIVGGDGFDVITGGDGDDTIFGNAQNDIIDGNDGDDVIAGGFGDDTIHGNDDNDYIKGDRGRDVIYGDADDDEIYGQGEPDILFGGTGHDVVVGGVGADIMFGDDGIVAKLDKDDPNDDVSVGNGDKATVITATLRGAADDVASSMDIIITDAVSGDGDDILSGDGGADIILGGGGDDWIGGDVDPRLAVANTPDKTTESGDDVIIGDGGIVQFDQRRLQRIASIVDNDPAKFRDIIYGDNGSDVIIGGQGGENGTTSFLGEVSVDRVLAGGHSPGRGQTDDGVSDDDVIIGDNGELIYADDSIADNFGDLERIRTTDTSNGTGGADTVYGELGDDIIFGGVNGSIDVLNGNLGNDVILGDNGEINFAFNGDTDLTTLDLVRSYTDGLGGEDHISGHAGEDVLIGGHGGDLIWGDDELASAGADDGEDIAIGDNADIFLANTVGRLLILNTAVLRITTTDNGESTGGADTITGNAAGDVIIGGVNNNGIDILHGDAPTQGGHDGNDLILGDNGELDFAFDGDTDQNTLDRARSYTDGLGGEDHIAGQVGDDMVIAGSGDDDVWGDDAGANAGAGDGEDILIGDNAEILLAGTSGRLSILNTAVKRMFTTDTGEATGGADTITGNAAGDVVIGGVNDGGVDILYGDAATQGGHDGNDLILGDNGELDFAFGGDTDQNTLDRVRSFTDGLGGEDHIAGQVGDDMVIAGSGGDLVWGDDAGANAGAGDGEDILIGDNAEILLSGTSGRLSILNTAVKRMFTTDTGEATGGADAITGDAADDVVIGGVNDGGVDILHGDAPTQGANDGNDLILGDNGELDFAFGGDSDQNTLDLIRSYTDALGGRDIISGDAGSDMILGGSGGDDIYGDDETASAGAGDGDEIILGDNGDVFLAGMVGARIVLSSAVERIVTTDDEEATGGADLVEGNAGGDIIVGGVNDGGVDYLYGDAAAPATFDGDDIVVGDNGVVDFNFEDVGANPLNTLDLIRTTARATDDTVLGGVDHIFGNAGDDTMLGGSAGDLMFGDNSESVEASGVADVHEADSGEDILIGDQGEVVRKNDIVDRIDTTDTADFGGGETEDVEGGADYMQGNDYDDVILGGVDGDVIHGEAELVNGLGVADLVTVTGDDIVIGDEGRLRYNVASVPGISIDGLKVAGDDNPLTLDLIQTFATGVLGADDDIFANGGNDIVMGGSDDDDIYGDLYSGSLHAALNPGEDVLIGDGGEMAFIDAATTVIRTIEPGEGGADHVEGDDHDDTIMGGFDGDELFGETTTVNLALTAGRAGNDVILGDNGRIDFVLPDDDIEGRQDVLDHLGGTTVTLDPDSSTLDRITTTDPTLGGDDVIYGNGNTDPDAGDLIFGGTGSDTIRGDTDDALPDGVDGVDGKDLAFGDHGKIYPTLPAQDAFFVNNNFFSIDTQVGDLGNGDVMYGNANNDILIGGQGDDVMFGGTQDDDMIGGHNVAGGHDDLDAMPVADQLAISPNVLADLNPSDVNDINDIMDGGADDDVIAGDNAIVIRQPNAVNGDALNSPRFRMVGADGLAYRLLADNVGGLADIDVGFEANVTDDYQPHQDMTLVRTVTLLDHSEAIEDAAVASPGDPRPFGNDIIAGGTEDDEIFGQLGDDIIQGDGEIEVIEPAKLLVDFDPYNPAQDADPSFDARNFTIRFDLDAGNDSPATLRFSVFETLGDGDDYIEGNGGNDRIYGNLGQDDLIGGSSTLFGLGDDDAGFHGVDDGVDLRPDGADLIYGGAGNVSLLSRNADFGGPDNDVSGDTLVPDDERHARDADTILGDNGDIFRLVTIVDPDTGAIGYDTYNYDYDSTTADGFVDDGYGGDTLTIHPRAVNLVDYGYAYVDHDNDASTREVLTFSALARGEGDLIYGESGDDVIHGMTGNDVIFGNSEHDDLYGEIGTDYLLGGTGVDGIVGDDGLILTSRNDLLAEPLNGIAARNPEQGPLKNNDVVDLNALNTEIATPGNIQRAVINIENELVKGVELFAFRTDDLDDATAGEFGDSLRFNDIIFGGLQNDFIHAGDGDDAVSGAEALPAYYSGEGFGFTALNTFMQAMQNQPFNPDPDLADNPSWFGFAPYNPGDILRFEGKEIIEGNFQTGKTTDEFAWYDEFNPRKKIVFDFDNVEVVGRIEDFGGNAIDFLLNFEETEGPDGFHFEGDDAPLPTDGADRIFGDTGNDWMVGGSGRDHMYGGRGDDLINMDDDHDSGAGGKPKPHDPPPGALDNTQSDEFQAYGDIVYSGAGRDVMILNTGADRAIDWVGEYNSYIVPFSPFGAFHISRTLQPQVPEFLFALSASDGVDASADPARLNNVPDAQLYVDQKNLDVRVDDPDPLRNFEPYGELGMVRQTDFDWQDQTGAPNDPQPGNFGGKREIMRRELFSDSLEAAAFAADVGSFSVTSGAMQASPEIVGGETVSIFYLDQTQPDYMEVLATVNLDKDKQGLKSNAYLIFDYQSDSDFKFAGINAGLDKIQIGHRTEAGWVVDTQTNMRLWDNRDYDLTLVLHGTLATIWVNEKTAASFDFGEALNDGLLGVGTDNAVARFDDYQVQKLPPTITYVYEAEEVAALLTAVSGSWSLDAEPYTGTAAAGDYALAAMPYDVSETSLIEIRSEVSTDAVGGIVFDYQGADSFKYAVLDAAASKLLIGHHTDRGWFIDADVDVNVKNSGNEIGLSLFGTSVAVTVDGTAVASYAYNALVTDGLLALLSKDGTTDFENVVIQGDDSALQEIDPANALHAAAPAPDGAVVPALDAASLDGVWQAALHRLGLDSSADDADALDLIKVRIADLPGLMVGAAVDGQILIDRTAAGHGWFVDQTPYDDAEFSLQAGNPVNGSKLDLLSVLAHELGHLMGLEHSDGQGVMGASLEAGSRSIQGGPAPDAATGEPADAPAVQADAGTFDFAMQSPALVFGPQGLAVARPTAQSAAAPGSPEAVPAPVAVKRTTMVFDDVTGDFISDHAPADDWMMVGVAVSDSDAADQQSAPQAEATFDYSGEPGDADEFVVSQAGDKPATGLIDWHGASRTDVGWTDAAGVLAGIQAGVVARKDRVHNAEAPAA